MEDESVFYLKQIKAMKKQVAFVSPIDRDCTLGLKGTKSVKAFHFTLEPCRGACKRVVGNVIRT